MKLGDRTNLDQEESTGMGLYPSRGKKGIPNFISLGYLLQSWAHVACGALFSYHESLTRLNQSDECLIRAEAENHRLLPLTFIICFYLL